MGNNVYVHNRYNGMIMYIANNDNGTVVCKQPPMSILENLVFMMCTQRYNNLDSVILVMADILIIP